jgi:hypothetical protein
MDSCVAGDSCGSGNGNDWVISQGSTIIDEKNVHLVYPVMKPQSERLANLNRIGRELWGMGKTSGEILAILAAVAAEQTGNYAPHFIDDMTHILLGWDSWATPFCGPFGDTCDRDPSNLLAQLADGGSGFLPQFQDPAGTPRSSQPAHFWEYVAIAFEYDHSLALTGNLIHESAGQGASWQDLLLGQEGALLGFALKEGLIKPNEVSQWIKDNLLMQ